MNDKINKNDISCLKDSTISYPTWEYFKNFIVESNNDDFPFLIFGNHPMKYLNDQFVKVDSTQKFKDIIKDKEFIGVDVPVLINSNNKINNKTIIIVGESPLRNTKNIEYKDIIQLGTPYAIHQEFNSP